MQQVIDLIKPECSDVKFEIFTFNDGEPHFKFTEELNHKNTYRIVTRITNPTELFILLQVGNILERHGLMYSLYITYLMSMRMDRVMTFNEAFSLEIVANMLKTIHPYAAGVFEVHSIRSLMLTGYESISDGFLREDPEYIKFENEVLCDIDTIICYPDNGAKERYHIAENIKQSYFILDKTRAVETGEITGMDIKEKHLTTCVPQRIVIMDDLCDGGRTFVEANKILKKEYPEMPVDIFVKHVVNPKGLQNMIDNFDHVYITDSYANYESTEKVTVFKSYARNK